MRLLSIILVLALTGPACCQSSALAMAKAKYLTTVTDVCDCEVTGVCTCRAGACECVDCDRKTRPSGPTGDFLVINGKTYYRHEDGVYRSHRTGNVPVHRYSLPVIDYYTPPRQYQYTQPMTFSSGGFGGGGFAAAACST